MGKGRKSRHRTKKKTWTSAAIFSRPDAPPKRFKVLITGGNPTIEIDATEVTARVDNDYIDATSFGNINKTYLAGRRRWTITATE
jgi:organic radical activating enzyme